MKKLISMITVVLFSLSLLECAAFVIPDLNAVGRNPEIISIEPKYLVPGRKVKVRGNNFFSNPKNANKIRINGKPVRVLKASSTELEIVIPRLKFGRAEITLFTKYLGLKSKKTSFKSDIVISPPIINFPEDVGVIPNKDIYLTGMFNRRNKIYFKIAGEKIEGKVLSKDRCKLVAPEKLPKGLVELSASYSRKLKSGEVVTSPLTEKLTFYNVENGDPVLIKLFVDKTSFEELGGDTSYRVIAHFKNGQRVDVTKFSEIDISKSDVVENNSNEKLLKINKPGRAEITASFIWKPTGVSLLDKAVINIIPPSKPKFAEVIVDEIFPFASGLFPGTDANMDGFPRVSDEFVEFKNLTNKRFDLSGCEVYVGEKEEPTFIFPEMSFIDQNAYLVVFGDELEEKKWNLSNSGSVIELVCDGRTVDHIGYPSGRNGDPSWQRLPDLSGFKKHPVEKFSPGNSPPEEIVSEPESEEVLETDSNDDASEDDGTEDSIAVEENLEEKELVEIITNPSMLTFDSLSPISLMVLAKYDDNSNEDVTALSVFRVEDESIIEIVQPGLFKAKSNGSTEVGVEFADIKIDVDAVVNLKSSVMSMQLIINEILSAPLEDVNLDGSFDTADDEFVEIVNISGETLDLGGLVLEDKTKVRHTFSFGTLINDFESVVIFGGGNVDNFQGSSLSFVSDSGSIGLNNTGTEEIRIKTSEGDVIDEVIYSNDNLKGVSLNRKGDLLFESFEPHNLFILSMLNYSPGLRLDGNSFVSSPQKGHELLIGEEVSSSSSGSVVSSSSSSGLTLFSSSSSGG